MWRYCGHLTGGIGLFGLLTGILSITLYSKLYDAIFESYMIVEPGSMSYEMWEELPLPMYMKVFYYNCTNHENVTLNNAQPILKQLGPYVFQEYHKKENITFQSNNTVAFHQTKSWQFREDLSAGSLYDEFYTLNVIAITAAESTRWPEALAPGDFPFLRLMMDQTLKINGDELFMKTNVLNITFAGIESDLLTMMVGTPLEGAIQMPFDKFGWFYDRNNSADYDGWYEMWTGEDNLQKVGQITGWNGHSDLSYLYPSPCHELTGSAGEFFPPNRDKSSVSYFTTDLCRPIFFNYKEETEVEGIKGYKYWLDQGFIGNATYNETNSCYNPHPDLVQQPKDVHNNGMDIPEIRPIEGAVDLGLYNGLLNVTACKFNAPAFVSFPHFYLADPALREAFDNSSDFWPNEAEHESYISILPEPGIPLDVAIRMQINFLVRELEMVDLLTGVNTMMYPMIWFETTTQLTDDMVSQLKFLEIAPQLGNIIGGCITGIAAILALVGGYLVFFKSNTHSQFV